MQKGVSIAEMGWQASKQDRQGGRQALHCIC